MSTALTAVGGKLRTFIDLANLQKFIFSKHLPRSVPFLARTQTKSCVSSPDLLCGLYSVNINIGRASLAQSYAYLSYLLKAVSIRVLF